MKILMVLTSHDKLGNTGRKTGFWLEEFAALYFTFKDAGAEITLASPKGGQPPLDPKSNEPNFQTDLTHRFEADADVKARLATTGSPRQRQGRGLRPRLLPRWSWADVGSRRRRELDQAGRILPGGPKTIALVCHSSGALRHVKTPNGKPLVEGKTVTGFTNGEEEG